MKGRDEVATVMNGSLSTIADGLDDILYEQIRYHRVWRRNVRTMYDGFFARPFNPADVVQPYVLEPESPSSHLVFLLTSYLEDALRT